MLTRRTRVVGLALGIALTTTLTAPRQAQASDSGTAAVIGLALLGGGLITAGPGLTILAVCDEGASCHSDATTTIGWVLAAPGIPPIVVGTFLLFATVKGGRGSVYNTPPKQPGIPVTFTAGPIPSGWMASGTYVF